MLLEPRQAQAAAAWCEHVNVRTGDPPTGCVGLILCLVALTAGPPKGFTDAATQCETCSWTTGSCSGSSAQDYIEKSCLGEASCGPFPANNGNQYDGEGKGDPCPGVSKRLAIAVRCCPPTGCPLLDQWGAQFLLVAFIGCGTYLGAGAAFRHQKHGARGADLLMHRSFWTELRVSGPPSVFCSRPAPAAAVCVRTFL